MTDSTFPEKCVRALKKAAEIYEGRDKHALTAPELSLVTQLEELAFIEKNNPETGFVGKAHRQK